MGWQRGRHAANNAKNWPDAGACRVLTLASMVDVPRARVLAFRDMGSRNGPHAETDRKDPASAGFSFRPRRRGARRDRTIDGLRWLNRVTMGATFDLSGGRATY